jgi:hypothetical protein
MKAVLYRHFSAAGELLYVGCSLRFLDRTAQHSANAEWFSEIANITLQHFDSPRSALLAEEQAIKAERPRYNFAHNPGAVRKTRRVWPTNAHPQLDALKRLTGRSDQATAFLSSIPKPRMRTIRETGELLGVGDIRRISKGLGLSMKKLAAYGIEVT